MRLGKKDGTVDILIVTSKLEDKVENMALKWTTNDHFLTNSFIRSWCRHEEPTDAKSELYH